MMMRLFRGHMLAAVALATAFGVTTAPATAATIRYDAFDNGWYDEDGLHQPDNPNITTGQVANPFGGQRVLRSFFAFDVSGAGEALAASITFVGFNGQMRTVGAEGETVGLFDYAGNIDTLLDGTGGTAAYDDLGTGTLLGQHTVPGTDLTPMPEFTITLGADFLALFNAARESADPRIVLGAALLSIEGPGGQNFWSGAWQESAAYLTVVEARDVPEPGALAIAALGMGGIGLAGRLRSARRRSGRA